jgi:hypothetical protein
MSEKVFYITEADVEAQIKGLEREKKVLRDKKTLSALITAVKGSPYLAIYIASKVIALEYNT